MNLEEFREYCLSLGEVEEKMPFAKMPGGDSVLVFYVSGHTFCYCDLNDLRVVVKCPPERIPELLDTAEGVTPPTATSASSTGSASICRPSPTNCSKIWSQGRLR